MKKSIFIALIFSLILTGCSWFLWEYPPDEALFINNNEWWGGAKPFNELGMTVFADAPFKDHNFRVTIDVSDKILFPDVRDSMTLYFNSSPRFNELTGYKYQFDSSKVYLITSSQKYHLKVIDYATGEPIGYSVKDIKEDNYVYRFYRYYLPVTCEQLDGASLEVSGIYQNGVELPPIKFQVFLINEGMKSCMREERTKE